MEFVDRDGREIGFLEWSRLFGDINYRTVNQTQIGNVKVSTVWIGLRAMDGGPFETMIFGGPGNRNQWRWRTEWEAMEGHSSIVALVEDGHVPVPREEVNDDDDDCSGA